MASNDESYSPDLDLSYEVPSQLSSESSLEWSGRAGRRGRGRRGRARGRVESGGGETESVYFSGPRGTGQRGRTRESGGSSERGGSSGTRGGRGGRGRRGRGRGARDAEEEERILALQNERRVQTETLIQQMNEVDLRALAVELFSREPGLIFDALIHQNQPTGPPSITVPWCRCGNCREMATDLERKCCGQGPNNCISQLPHFNLYCLHDGYLRLHRRYRNDVLVIGEAQEPGDDNREFRHAAYRQYIFWQHGALGQGNRMVIPSCCVWRIRDKYPDPQSQYTGFIPHL